jgi:hypothetical protein
MPAILLRETPVRELVPPDRICLVCSFYVRAIHGSEISIVELDAKAASMKTRNATEAVLVSTR